MLAFVHILQVRIHVQDEGFDYYLRASPRCIGGAECEAGFWVCLYVSLLPLLLREADDEIGLGSNESGAEFGETKLPGVLGTDYIWPSASTIKTLHDAGMNIFRVAFRMERLIPNQMTGTPDATYMNDLKAVRLPVRVLRRRADEDRLSMRLRVWGRMR